MKFFVGLHQPSDAKHFDRCLISINRLWRRCSDIPMAPTTEWMLDSGAYSEIAQFGDYRESVETYAAQIRRWARCGQLVTAVAQDYLCHPQIVADYNRTVAQHQHMTIARYDALLNCDIAGVYIMPTLQGWEPRDYVAHLSMYGDRLAHSAWVGVGSVASRSADPAAVLAICSAIKKARPDLRLHGFGIKLSALRPSIRQLLFSADSLAWSYAARREGRDANDWREAQAYARRVDGALWELPLFQQDAA